MAVNQESDLQLQRIIIPRVSSKIQYKYISELFPRQHDDDIRRFGDWQWQGSRGRYDCKWQTGEKFLALWGEIFGKVRHLWVSMRSRADNCELSQRKLFWTEFVGMFWLHEWRERSKDNFLWKLLSNFWRKISNHSHLSEVQQSFLFEVWRSFIYIRQVRQINAEIWNTGRIVSVIVNIKSIALSLYLNFLPVQSVPKVPVSAVTGGDILQFVQSVFCLQFNQDMNISISRIKF